MSLCPQCPEDGCSVCMRHGGCQTRQACGMPELADEPAPLWVSWLVSGAIAVLAVLCVGAVLFAGRVV